MQQKSLAGSSPIWSRDRNGMLSCGKVIILCFHSGHCLEERGFHCHFLRLASIQGERLLQVHRIMYVHIIPYGSLPISIGKIQLIFSIRRNFNRICHDSPIRHIHCPVAAAVIGHIVTWVSARRSG